MASLTPGIHSGTLLTTPGHGGHRYYPSAFLRSGLSTGRVRTPSSTNSPQPTGSDEGVVPAELGAPSAMITRPIAMDWSGRMAGHCSDAPPGDQPRRPRARWVSTTSGLP